MLKAHGIATGKKLTSYPSVKDELVKDYQYSEDKVVVDGEIVLLFSLRGLFCINVPHCIVMGCPLHFSVKNEPVKDY